MSNIIDLCIIGGGVVGAAIAREASKYELKIVLLEKESDVAEGISKANSGVIHAGFNVKPGSLKAKFNIEGLSYFPKICEELDIGYSLCKKLVIAKNDDELKYLEKIFDQGKKNGSPGLSIIAETDIKNLEPNIEGKYALFSEKTAIITPYEFTIALAENAFQNGVNIYLNTEVVGIIKNPDNNFCIQTKDSKIFTTKYVINAAGLFSDQIAGLIEECEYEVFPCRGEYYILDQQASDLVKMAVYPVPPADGSGLGIHLTPTINGNILIGPSAEYINDKADIRNTKKTMDQLKKEAYELLPKLKNIPFIKNFSGIRPKLFNAKSNTNFEDFIIEESKQMSNFINLIGIESPGLTSAPAIAKYIVETIFSKKIELKEKKKFNAFRQGIKRTKFLASNELLSLIEKDRNYAEVLCRCEQITKGEILAALNNPFQVKTLNGIKKRTHAMMGRCQNGFCLPKIIEVLTNEYNLDPYSIVRKNEHSHILRGNTLCKN
ncbi:MAG: NAD(P)/FAD-dependent oxidoreductase [Candidatus Margulisiibacteriota bacterium]|jgi:glycerol-3-phosphate dehydrogenase